MSARTVFFCDNCGIDRKDANHWFVALEKDRSIRIWKWRDGITEGMEVKHLCGEQCVHSFVGGFLKPPMPLGDSSVPSSSN